MATVKHHKHCTFKKTQVCICANLDAALKDLEAKHRTALANDRAIRHKDAVNSYRDGIIRAFTNLIDEKFETESECSCTDRYGRYY